MTRPDPPDADGAPFTDEPDAELADLFAAERRRPGPAPGTAHRVQAAVLATVAATASTAAAATAATATTAATGAATASTTTAAVTAASTGGAAIGTGAMVAAALAATVAGTVFIATADVSPPADAATTPATTVDLVEPPRPAPPPGLVIDAPAMAPPLTPTPTPTPTVASTSPKPAPTTPAEQAARQEAELAAERLILGEARQALGRDDIAAALGHLERHRAAWPRGHLVEEREALSIMARARRGDDVTDDVTDFGRRHPGSLFLDALGRVAR